MKELQSFDEFEYSGYTVTLDFGSAFFEFEDGLIYVQGRARKGGDLRLVEARFEPEDTPEFNNDASASDGEIVGDMFSYTVIIEDIEDVETEELL